MKNHNRLKRIINQYFDVDIDQKTQERNNSISKRIYIAVLHEKYAQQITLTNLSKTINLHHTSAIYHLKQHKNHYNLYPDYAEKYDLINLMFNDQVDKSMTQELLDKLSERSAINKEINILQEKLKKSNIFAI